MIYASATATSPLLRRLRLAPVGTGQIVAARIGISVAIGLIQMAVFFGIATLPYFGLKLTYAWYMAIPLVIVMPLAYLVKALQGVMARGDGPAAALPAIGILLGFTLVLILIAVRVFRWDDV